MHQTTEFEGKGTDGKEKDSSKKSKGTSANTCAKAGESGKAGSGSGNDGFSQRFGKPLKFKIVLRFFLFNILS
jgi:plant G-box-binding factor